MGADLEGAITAWLSSQAALAAERAKKDELARLLLSVASTAETARNNLGRAIADGTNIAAAKAALTTALVEAEGYEAAHREMQIRVKRAAAMAREAQQTAWRLESDEHVAEAETLRAETLAAAAVLGRSHRRWHALARRCEELATLIGRPGQPVPYDGQYGQLCRKPDDGQGISDVLRTLGISATFGGIRDRLPRIDTPTGFDVIDATEADDDDEGCIIVAGERSASGQAVMS
jgi:hypothetical protein